MSLILIIAILIVIVVVVGFVIWRRRARGLADLNDDERTLLQARIFDQFKLQSVRKRATVSTMYGATDTETKKKIALRILQPQYAADPEQVKGFRRRGEILEFLNREHPDLPIVRLVKYGEYRLGRLTRPFIAVEYFEGQDLGELLSERKILTVADATSIISQITRALSVALREKVWHHQMALQAVMVRSAKSGAPEVKLVDFDLHRQEQNATSSVAMGVESKLIFMSPEQFEGKIVDARSDVYSLGVLYYMMLTGSPPFVGTDYGEMSRMHLTVRPPALPGSIPAPVKSIVTKALEKLPSNRFASMDELDAALRSLQPESSWSNQPDLSSFQPPVLVSRRPTSEPTPKPTKPPVREPRPERVTRKKGALNFLFIEFPLMFVSLIGRIFTRLLPKVSVKKIAIVVLLAIVGAIAYLVLHVATVKGTLSLLVKERQGKSIPEAAVVIDPLGMPEKGYVRFVDLATKQESKGRFESKTSTNGEMKAEYSVSPNTKLLVSVRAEGHTSAVDTIMIRGDSTIVLSYALVSTAAPPPQQLTVEVRDASRNPIPSVSVVILGNSGKEYTASVDERGIARIQYDPTSDGVNPRVSLSAEALGPEFARSEAKPQRISGRQLMIDINDYFPYDKTISGFLSQAQSLIANEKWKEAVATLQQLVAMQPGPGSGRAYTLMAQALFEDNDDRYNDALKALRKAALDERNIKGRDHDPIIEKMYYYRVRALRVAWDRAKEPGLKQELRQACTQYLNLYLSPNYNALLKASNKVEDHRDKVKDIADDVK